MLSPAATTGGRSVAFGLLVDKRKLVITKRDGQSGGEIGKEQLASKGKLMKRQARELLLPMIGLIGRRYERKSIEACARPFVCMCAVSSLLARANYRQCRQVEAQNLFAK